MPDLFAHLRDQWLPPSTDYYKVQLVAAKQQQAALAEQLAEEQARHTAVLASVLPSIAALREEIAKATAELNTLVATQAASNRRVTDLESVKQEKDNNVTRLHALLTERVSQIAYHNNVLARPVTQDSWSDLIVPSTVWPTIEAVGDSQRLSLAFVTYPFRLVQRKTGMRSIGKVRPLLVKTSWARTRIGGNLAVDACFLYRRPSPDEFACESAELAELDYNPAIVVERHPHINSSGAVCLGDETTRLHTALEQGDLPLALNLLATALRTVNTSSTYYSPADYDQDGPWSRLQCPDCNAEGSLTLLGCAHVSALQMPPFCASCLRQGPVLHCGSCSTCCGKHHVFSLRALEDHSGLNNSGCERRP